MKKPEVSPKALSAWLTAAMVGPVALVSASSSWLAVLVAVILCGLLCIAIFRFSGGLVWKNKGYCVVAILWNLYAAAVVAAQGSICWPGKGAELVIPLMLILLAALSAVSGAQNAAAVSATLWPLCAAVFALALICGIGSLETTRIEFSTAVPEGMLLFTLLLPVSAAAIPRREGSGVTKPIAVLSVFAVAFSIVVVGTLSLPVALTRKDAFFEFAKSLGLFGTVQRFESLVAVAVTISVFSMLSLLYSGIGTMAEYTHPGSRKPVVILCAGTSAAIVAAKLWLSPKLLALLSLLIWGILSVLCQTVATHKSLKKGENTS